MPSYFLRFSSISLHCSPIQFSFAFFMYLLMLLFTSPYFSDPSGSHRYVLSSLLLSHRSRISAVARVFFFRQCLPTILQAVSVTAVLKVVIIESRSVSSSLPTKLHAKTLSKAFLKSMKTWWRSCWCRRYFSQRIRRLKICSVLLLPALKPTCSSAVIFSACGFNLFSMENFVFSIICSHAVITRNFRTNLYNTRHRTSLLSLELQHRNQS